MYDVTFLLGAGLLIIGGLLVTATRRRGNVPQQEVDRRFQDIVRRLGN